MNILNHLATAVLIAAALSVAACGDDDNAASEGRAETAATQDAGLAAIWRGCGSDVGARLRS